MFYEKAIIVKVKYKKIKKNPWCWPLMRPKTVMGVTLPGRLIFWDVVKRLDGNFGDYLFT